MSIWRENRKKQGTLNIPSRLDHQPPDDPRVGWVHFQMRCILLLLLLPFWILETVDLMSLTFDNTGRWVNISCRFFLCASFIHCQSNLKLFLRETILTVERDDTRVHSRIKRLVGDQQIHLLDVFETCHYLDVSRNTVFLISRTCHHLLHISAACLFFLSYQ